MSTMDLVSIVIPAYNEQEAIGDDLDLVILTMDAADIPYEIIVVNDGSTDRTAEIAAAKHGVQVIHHGRNRGTGAARTTGLKAARGRIVIMTDADGTYPNQDMPKLLEYMERCDMVIGARKEEKGTVRWLRTPAKAFVRRLASYLTSTPIPDLNSGLRAFDRNIALKYLSILPNTHSWVSTIAIAFLSDGYRVEFMPIDYYTRKGKSKFHPIKDTYNYLTLVVRSVMYFNPLAVFLPVSLALAAFGSLKLIRDLIVYNLRVPTNTILVLLTAVQLGAMGLLADLIVKKTGK